MKAQPWIAVAALFLIVGAIQVRAGDAPARAEVIQAAKKATIVLHFPGDPCQYASAFCVHPAGVLVTTVQACQSVEPEGTVKVIVNVGEAGAPHTLNARIVRREPALNVAVLLLDKTEGLTALPLGRSDGLAELSELIVCGTHHKSGEPGTVASLPAVGVHPAKLTALQRKAGEVQGMNLDCSLEYSHRGSPILNAKGQVVGLVKDVNPSERKATALPVEFIISALKAPDVQFTPPALDVANLDKAIAFEARVTSLLPVGKPLEVDLVINHPGDEERRLPMKSEAGVFKVTAIPVPAAKGPQRLSILLNFPTGAVLGTVDDQAVKVGARELRLAGIRSIKWQGEYSSVTLVDGQALTGAVIGLDKLSVRVGEATVTLDPGKSTETRIEAPQAAQQFTWSLIVRQEGKEVRRLTDTSFQDKSAARLKLPFSVLAKKKVVRMLPSEVTDLAVGGGGRYLVLHLPKEQQLAIFDAQQASIVKYLTVAEETIRFAASQDKLIVVLPRTGVIMRYDLTTFEREAVKPLPFTGTVWAVSMGSASQGPLLVHYAAKERQNAQIGLIGLDTLMLTTPRIDPGQGFAGQGFDSTGQFRAAPNGKVFAMWRMNSSPQGIYTFVVDGESLKARYEHGDAGYLIPAQDGQHLFTARGLYSMETLHPVRTEAAEPRPVLPVWPAASGQYFVRLTPGKKGTSVDVGLLGQEQAMVRLDELEGFSPAKPVEHDQQHYGYDPFGPGQPDRQGKLPRDKRFHLLPAQAMIVVIPTTNDRLVLHHFDLEQTLEASNKDYLIVTSQPAASVQRGEAYKYQMAVRSRGTNLRYQLHAGPTGMTISPAGLVSWAVPKDFVGNDTRVLLAVSDASGLERFQSFTITIRPWQGAQE